MALINTKDCPCDGCKAKPCGHPAHCKDFALWLNKTVKPEPESRPTFPRPCLVHRESGEIQKALLYGFYNYAEPLRPSVMRGGHTGGQFSQVIALLEVEDGNLIQAETNRMIMLDSDRIFDTIPWEALVNEYTAKEKERSARRGV